MFLVRAIISRVLIAALLFNFGCKKPKTKERQSPPGESEEATATPTPTEEAKRGSKIKANLTDYKPTTKDSLVFIERTRTWQSDGPEPEVWQSEAKVQQNVVGIYKAGLRCKYRTQSKSDAGEIVEDYGCPLPPVCAKIDNPCKTEIEYSTDVGNLKDAAGEITTCQFVTNAGDLTYVTKSETTIWRHQDVLWFDHIAKFESRTCVLNVPKDKFKDGMDPCKPPEGTAATISRIQRYIDTQTKGQDKLEEISRNSSDAMFKTSGALPEPSGDKLYYAACRKIDDKLSIVLNRGYCANNAAHTDYLAVGGLPPQAGTFKVGENQAGLTTDNPNKTFLAKVADSCSVEVKAVDNYFTGKITCPTNAFTETGGTALATLTEATYSCPKP